MAVAECLAPTDHVILFTRVPVAGRAKTRLRSVLPPERCAELQWAMARDLVARLSPVTAQLTVSLGDDARDLPRGDAVEARFRADLEAVCAPGCSIDFEGQVGPGLGERMEHAIDSAFARGASRVLLLGSDLPHVGAPELLAAARAMERADGVLCPSEDGGYWLVGLSRPCHALFSSKRYGGSSVLQEALAAARADGLTMALGPRTTDVDTGRDLERLYLARRRSRDDSDDATLRLIEGWVGAGELEGVLRSHPVRGPDDGRPTK